MGPWEKLQLGRREVDRRGRPIVGLIVIQPAELQLLPRAHVAGRGADRVGAMVQPRAGAHQSPETGAVVATGGVVEVRQTEVVAELVGEDTEATVLGLGGVVTDPHPGATDPSATDLGTSSEVVHTEDGRTSGTKVCGVAVSYTHLRAHETDSYLVCRLLLEKKKK